MKPSARRPVYTVANADITKQLTSLPVVSVDGGTLETLIKISNWIAAATENAGTMAGQLLTEHRADPAIVRSAHDLLGELAAIRQSALLVEMVLARVQPEGSKQGEQLPIQQ